MNDIPKIVIDGEAVHGVAEVQINTKTLRVAVLLEGGPVMLSQTPDERIVSLALEIETMEARVAERQTPTAAAKVIEQADIRLDRGDTLVALLERATERSFQLNRFRPDSQADRDDLTLRSLTAVLKGGRWFGGKFVPDAAAEEEGSQ